MIRILKQQVGPGLNEISFPRGSKIVKFAFQRGVPTVWIESPSAPVGCTIKSILVVITGEQFPKDGLEYIGTDLTDDGEYVLHAYASVDQLY